MCAATAHARCDCLASMCSQPWYSQQKTQLLVLVAEHRCAAAVGTVPTCVHPSGHSNVAHVRCDCLASMCSHALCCTLSCMLASPHTSIGDGALSCSAKNVEELASNELQRNAQELNKGLAAVHSITVELRRQTKSIECATGMLASPHTSIGDGALSCRVRNAPKRSPRKGQTMPKQATGECPGFG
jgi:hypothetical protein